MLQDLSPNTSAYIMDKTTVKTAQGSPSDQSDQSSPMQSAQSEPSSPLDLDQVDPAEPSHRPSMPSKVTAAPISNEDDDSMGFAVRTEIV